MKKPDSLRAAIVGAFPDLKRDPDRLQLFIDQGSLACTGAAGFSFEYAYTLNVILTDFAADPDIIMVPILSWVRVNQNELLFNPDKRGTGITFEADILDTAKVDLSLKLQLTERVIVKQSAPGRITISHADEPVQDAALGPGHWTVYVRDEIAAEWDIPT